MKPAEIRKRLTDMRAEIMALAEIASEDRAPVALDQQAVGRLSRMDAIQRQNMAKAQDASRQRDLARIAAALSRLDAGEYGVCAECGEAIPPQRLEIDPMAERCVVCAGRAG